MKLRKGGEKNMGKINIFSVVTVTILVVVAGGCGGIKDLREDMSPPSKTF